MQHPEPLFRYAIPFLPALQLLVIMVFDLCSDSGSDSAPLDQAAPAPAPAPPAPAPPAPSLMERLQNLAMQVRDNDGAMMVVAPNRLSLDMVGDLLLGIGGTADKYLALRAQDDMDQGRDPTKAAVKAKSMFVLTPEKVSCSTPSLPLDLSSAAGLCCTLHLARPTPGHVSTAQARELVRAKRCRVLGSRPTTNGLREVCKESVDRTAPTVVVYLHTDAAHLAGETNGREASTLRYDQPCILRVRMRDSVDATCICLQQSPRPVPSCCCTVQCAEPSCRVMSCC